MSEITNEDSTDGNLENQLSKKPDLDITEAIDFINNESDTNDNIVIETNVESTNIDSETKASEENLNHDINIEPEQTTAGSGTDKETNNFVNDFNLATNGDKNDLSDDINNKLKSEKLMIIDSDMESINIDNSDPINNENDIHASKPKSKKLTIIDSDTDEEPTQNEKVSNPESNTKDTKQNKKRISVIDSDDDEEIFRKSLSHDSEDEISRKLHDTDREQKSRFTALCDSDSSDDDIRVPRINLEDKPILNFKKTKCRDEKPKKMTGRDAVDQRRQIQSESQRMQREQGATLPYHNSRSHSLKEFLERRSNRLGNIGIKMTKEQLEVTAKKLEEREKQLEEFYKSDEENDEENDEEKSEPVVSEKNISDVNVLNDNTTNKEQNDEPNNSSKKPSKIFEKLKKLNPLLRADFKPQICKEKDIIVFDDVEKTKAISALKKRFIAHNAMKYVDSKDEKEIQSLDSKILQHESAKALIDHDDGKIAVEQKPGEKLKKLRHELEVQMAKKRWEQFEKLQKEEEEMKIDDEELSAKKIDDEEYIPLDDEEEEEMTESSSEEDEEEILEERRPKSDFIDDEADDESENDSDFEELEPLKKDLKRVIKPCSDSEENDDDNNDTLNTTQSVHDFIPSDDEEIPVYQRENLNKTPHRISESKSEFNLTPTLCLTALQGISATKRALYESPTISLSFLEEPSPLRSHPGVKTKLFDSNDGEETVSQVYNELEGLCSGKFSSNFGNSTLTSQEKDLLGISSGKFDENIPDASNESNSNFNVNIPGYSTEGNMDQELSEISKSIRKDLEKDFPSGFEHENSQDMRLTLDIPSSVPNTLRKLVLLSSDEEEPEEVPKREKRKRKGLEFSDDEESDIESEVLLSEEEPEELPEVNYDSEENEVVYDKNEEIIPEKGAKNFFDAEAELSESEWGSEDEDEKGLDELEMEDGDDEHFNERKLQKELGKIHARQVLDQDNREVRLLQELLLEDGELHGAGRERKFKWKNADSMTWEEDEPKDDEQEEIEEIESELEWRKSRHEREVFLAEERRKAMQNTNEIELLTNDSQIMKLGHELLKKSQETTKEALFVSTRVETFSFMAKRGFRGSFLARSENTLSRLAEMTKGTEKEILGTKKNSKNFVFLSKNKEEMDDEEVEEKDKKRKAPENTPKVLKKMRISENSPSGLNNNKKMKKRLFNPH